LAQKEASHWYFGIGAGLDFSSGKPVSDSKGVLNTEEGCATISNSKGELLFYTDGSTVWNRNHSIMPTGRNLMGNSSSTQSAIIVPKPNDTNIFYVFTVDWSGGENGLNYYTIDMQLDGGRGDVITANGTPDRTSLLSGSSSEKITAVKVFNENAYWVISHKEDRFYVYKVDTDGVNAVPVFGNDNFHFSTDDRGYLKISPDGIKLVSAHMTSGIYIYDFDDVNGIISNERRLSVENKFAYGTEFSPLSKKLYVTTGDHNRDGSPAEENLYQFNLDVSDPTSVNLNQSRVKLHTYLNKRSALQIGLDGKIYRARNNESFLGLINNPDANGLAANYVHDAIKLGNRISTQGLPPFIQSFFIGNILVENLCKGDETSFEVNSIEEINSILWDFGDDSATSNILNPKHTYAFAGEYSITVKVETISEKK